MCHIWFFAFENELTLQVIQAYFFLPLYPLQKKNNTIRCSNTDQWAPNSNDKILFYLLKRRNYNYKNISFLLGLPSLKNISESIWNAGEARQRQIQNLNCAFIIERSGNNTPSKEKLFRRMIMQKLIKVKNKRSLMLELLFFISNHSGPYIWHSSCMLLVINSRNLTRALVLLLSTFFYHTNHYIIITIIIAIVLTTKKTLLLLY